MHLCRQAILFLFNILFIHCVNLLVWMHIHATVYMRGSENKLPESVSPSNMESGHWTQVVRPTHPVLLPPEPSLSSWLLLLLFLERGPPSLTPTYWKLTIWPTLSWNSWQSSCFNLSSTIPIWTSPWSECFYYRWPVVSPIWRVACFPGPWCPLYRLWPPTWC